MKALGAVSVLYSVELPRSADFPLWAIYGLKSTTRHVDLKYSQVRKCCLMGIKMVSFREKPEISGEII